MFDRLQTALFLRRAWKRRGVDATWRLAWQQAGALARYAKVDGGGS